VDVKAGIIKIALKQKTSLLNKTEILTKAEIRKGVVNKQKAEENNRQPE
jgi:hypothetical protein